MTTTSHNPQCSAERRTRNEERGTKNEERKTKNDKPRRRAAFLNTHDSSFFVLRSSFLVLRSANLVLRSSLVAIACAANVRAEDAPPVTPKDGVIRLFNGQNLDGLSTWLKDTKSEDPRKVFTAAGGLLHITGEGLGGIVTKAAYRDYHLVIEFKWGERTWEPRKDKARDSGVLVHCTGPDGNRDGAWMNSIEAQIIEGGVGDIIVVRGTASDGQPLPLTLSAEVVKDRDGENVWKAGGEKVALQSGRVNWFGRDPDWKDMLGFRGKDDVESPFGKWTRLDVVCQGNRISNYVNGVKVNEAFDIAPDAGRILLQTEFAEFFVRRWELWPLGKAPPFKAEELNPPQ